MKGKNFEITGLEEFKKDYWAGSNVCVKVPINTINDILSWCAESDIEGAIKKYDEYCEDDDVADDVGEEFPFSDHMDYVIDVFDAYRDLVTVSEKVYEFYKKHHPDVHECDEEGDDV